MNSYFKLNLRFNGVGLCVKMWFWILIGLCIITKVHGFSDGYFPESCQTMLPQHRVSVPENTEPPFEVSYQHGEKGGPITVFLRSTTAIEFRGFMLEAREKGAVDVGPPVGKFILLEPDKTRLLKCNNLADSAVSQRNNVGKSLIKVNWTAEGAEFDVTLRATFVVSQWSFWEKVDVNVISPPPPPPSTTAHTTIPSTTAYTTIPSTTAYTTMPSTTAHTTKPSITELKTTALSTLTGSSTTPNNRTAPVKIIGTVLMTLDLVFVAFQMQLPNIVATTHADGYFSRCLLMVSVILCLFICVGLEISAAVLFYVICDSCKVTLFALVCVAIGINFIKLIIISLLIGLSHELKKICDISVKVCSVIHKIFIIAVIFIGGLEIVDFRNKWRESWLLKVMIAYTAWILLSVIWAFVFTVYRNAILGRSKTGNDKRGRQRKKKLSAVKGIGTAVSVILVLGSMSFTAAVIVGIFSEDCV